MSDSSIRTSASATPAFFFVLIGVQLFISGLLADLTVRNYYQARNRMNYNVKEVIIR
jgi:hypothetical protein